MKHITCVQALDNYQLLLTFNGDEYRIYDMIEWLDKPYFQPLRDMEFFKTVRVNIVTHTIEWPGERDLCPDYLYEESKPTV